MGALNKKSGAPVKSGESVKSGAPALKEIVAQAFGMLPEQVPNTFAGSPNETTLYMAIPSIVEPMLQRLYPQIPWDGSNEYFECLKHEIFHMFHEKAAIELCGSADGRSPPHKTLRELLVIGLSKGDVAESLFRPAKCE